MTSTPRDELILSIDAGTQSVRAALVDPNGAIHGLVKTPIRPYFATKPGWAEQDPAYYWEKLCETTRALFAADADAARRIVAVTVTTQRATMIVVDREGKPLRPAIVWLDQRKADASAIIPGFVGAPLRALGLSSLVEFAVGFSRSNWIRQNEPDVWAKTHKYLFLSGYLTHQLTGELRDSAGNVIGPIPFDVKRLDWAGPWDPKWKIFPIERERLADLVPPTARLGTITAAASEATGIPAGLPLIAASNDKACDVIGSGCLSPERACISFGTTATINTQNERYVELRPLLPPYPSAIPGQFYSEVAVVRGLWMVSWFKEEFGLQERQQAAEQDVSPERLLEKLLREVPAGSRGLMCQPYWTPGPELASFTKGAVVGFGDVHDRAHLYRAIIEGLAYALKEGAERTAKANGVAIREVRATGGGSQSDAILQITADVLDLPVARPHTNETSVVGAAMDAAVGLGLHPSFGAAAAAMTRVERVFEPIPANAALYGELYRRVYLRMYERLLPLYRDIQSITGYPS